MKNALRDTDGYEDPEAYAVEDVPKTLMYNTAVPY